VIFAKYYCNSGNLLDPCYYAGDKPCPVHGERRTDMGDKCLTCEVYSKYCCRCAVHGEGEKMANVPEGCIVNPVLSRVCERGTKSCGVYHQPSPTPTREEWVAWTDHMPEWHQITWDRWCHEFKEWLLLMPIVPKE